MEAHRARDLQTEQQIRSRAMGARLEVVGTLGAPRGDDGSRLANTLLQPPYALLGLWLFVSDVASDVNVMRLLFRTGYAVSGSLALAFLALPYLVISPRAAALLASTFGGDPRRWWQALPLPRVRSRLLLMSHGHGVIIS